jgi:uncharacterized membrane protein (UPF0127 family)
MEIQLENGETIRDVDRLTGWLEKVRGLSWKGVGRALLEFSYNDRHGVWMPFMKFTIDIAFVDDDGVVVGIEKNVPPISLHPRTWRVYKPPRMCRYVLEVEAGLLDEKEVTVGNKLAVEN